MDIRDFLAKPYQISSKTWATTDLVSATIDTGPIGYNLISNTFWANKLQGFQLIKGTAVIRVLINANPFQQGKLLLHFLPCFDRINSLDPSYAAMHQANLAAKRMQPCVELDCRDGAAVIKLPYITPSNWYNLKNQFYDWGTWILTVFSQLATGAAGETEVNVTTYLHFEDVELAAPMVPQSFTGPKTKFMAKTIGKSVADKELEAMSDRTISSALKIASTAAGVLGEIPTLAPVLKPASWILDASSQFATYAGYSKPVNNVNTINISQQYQRYGATSDGDDNALPLAMRSDNAITLDNGYSIYDSDEMSFDFLYKVSTLVSTFNWPAFGGSSLPGTILYSKDVAPRSLYMPGVRTSGATTINYGVGPGVYYLSNFFQQWRGSINVTIKLVKTEFHNGRLEVTWTPTTATNNTDPTLLTSIYALREIIDIKTGNEFTFNLPYMIEDNYIGTGTKSGRLLIRVLNELRAPETAAQSIDVLVYYSGGKDFELQVPGRVTDSNNWKSILPFSPQAFDKSGEEVIVNDGVGGEPLKTKSPGYAAMCTGEMPINMKQFLSRNSQIAIGTFPVAGDNISVYPWFNSCLYLTATGLSGPDIGPDIYSLFSPCFAFMSGGVKLHFQVANVNTTTASTQLMGVLTGLGLSTGDISGSINNTNWRSTGCISGLQGTAINQAQLGIISVVAPYYCRTKMSLNLRQTSDGNIQNDKSLPYNKVFLYNVGGFTKFGMYRSMAEDFKFHYFIGCPPIYIP